MLTFLSVYLDCNSMSFSQFSGCFPNSGFSLFSVSDSADQQLSTR